MLYTSPGLPRQVIDRVCWLVGHHHTYTDIDSLDYQILVEADFLADLWEASIPPEAQEQATGIFFKQRRAERSAGRCILQQRSHNRRLSRWLELAL